MNSLRNRVQLIGNLGKDPEVMTFDGGKTKASFSLATNDYYKNEKGEQIQNTEWHNVIAWGKIAELSEKLLKKGSEVAVEGKISTRKFEDKEGNQRSICEIQINELLLLDKKAEN